MNQTVYVENQSYNGGFYHGGSDQYNLPRGGIAISDGAARSNSPGPPPGSYPYTVKSEGIDTCAVTVWHEFRHKSTFEASWGGYTDELIGPGASWPGNRSTTNNRPEFSWDLDADGLRDDWEFETYGQDQTVADIYFLNKKYDGLAIQPDFEFDADMGHVPGMGYTNFPDDGLGARKYQLGTYDSQDWASPGKQTDPPGS